MWTKLLSILFLFALIFGSCNKEPSSWDREEELVIDTASFMLETQYISHIDSQVIFQVGIVTLNGLVSEKNYNNPVFYDSVRANFNYTYTINNVNTQQKLPTAYTTVLLFDQNGTYWHNESYMGVYLRRYFERVEKSTVSQIAMARFLPANNESIRFYKENTTSYFNNSWEYNTNKFYDLSNDNYNSNYVSTNILYMIDRLNETIDTLISAPNKNGDLSITLFSQGGYESFQSETTEINNLIAKAKTNNIKINLIGFENSYESEFRRITQETGGFICAKEINYNTYQYYYDNSKKITAIGVFLENLDLILQNKLTSHNCTIQVNKSDGSIYQSGERLSFPINYNHRLFTIQFTLP